MTGKSAGAAGKGRSLSKDMISLRTYVIPQDVPKSLVFSAHMLRFEGLKPNAVGADLLWGVQGTTSLNSADAFASRDAQRLKRRLYQIELVYKLSGLPDAGHSVTEDFASEHGYLHFSRITSEYREKLRAMMLEWLKASRDREYKLVAAMDFEGLVKNRPMMIHRLMKEFPKINTIIHPVLLPGGVSLRIATVRNVPANLMKVSTRFHAEIETSV